MKKLLTLIPVAIIGTVLIGCAVTQSNAVTGMPMEEMIQSAKTKADHEALAKHYEDEASAFQAKAEEHKRMAGAYRNVGKGGGAAFVGHCDRLIAQYQEAAKENLELAKLHRQMAEEAGG